MKDTKLTPKNSLIHQHSERHQINPKKIRQFVNTVKDTKLTQKKIRQFVNLSKLTLKNRQLQTFKSKEGG